MVKKEIKDMLEAQLNREIASSYLYMALCMKCKLVNFEGAAHWFRLQSIEELTHAEKLINYLSMQGEEVVLEQIDKPVVKGSTLLDFFTQTNKHEQFVTKCIHELTAAARATNDFSTEALMHWFISEQVEEEANVVDIISKLKLIGNDGSNLYLIDKELASRPAPATATV